MSELAGAARHSTDSNVQPLELLSFSDKSLIVHENRGSAPTLISKTPVSIGWYELRFVLIVALLFSTGCAGYQLGNATLFRNDVRTIYVPIIRNDTWRPWVGVQLTEAVQKAIQQRTPYRLVNDPSADSVLTCRVTNETKRVITETRTDEARALDAKLSVELTWVDRRNTVLMENRFVPPDDIAFYFAQHSTFAPEGGQSVSTAQMQAIDRLAQAIVDQMEARW